MLTAGVHKQLPGFNCHAVPTQKKSELKKPGKNSPHITQRLLCSIKIRSQRNNVVTSTGLKTRNVIYKKTEITAPM